MQDFLQRIVNGGGRLEREYGPGRMRTDLLAIWPEPGDQPAAAQRIVIEPVATMQLWYSASSSCLCAFV